MRNCNLKTLISEGTKFGRLTVVKLTDKRNNSGNRIDLIQIRLFQANFSLYPPKYKK